MSPVSLLLILAVSFCTVATQLLLKNIGPQVAQLTPELSLSNFSKIIVLASTEPKVIMAVGLQGLGFLMWIIVLSKEQAGMALGLGGASAYLLTAIAEWAMYDTQLSLVKICALFLISVGAILLAAASK